MAAQIDSAWLPAKAKPRMLDFSDSDISNTSELFIWEWDVSTDEFLENCFLNNCLGFSAEHTIRTSKQWRDYIHPKDLTKVSDALFQCVDGNASEFEIDCRMRDSLGCYRPFMVSGKVSRRDANGRALRMSGIISETKRLSKFTLEATYTDDILATVLKVVPQMIYWKNSDSQFVGCNLSFAEHMNIPDPQSIVGLSDRELGLSVNDRISRDEDLQILTGSRPRLVSVEQVVRDDGNIKWYEKTKVPLKNEAGDITGVLGTVYDLTGRAEAEHEI